MIAKSLLVKAEYFVLIFLNSGLVDEAMAVVSVYDHGFLYGDGIYETMRAYRGEVFGLDEHCRRLERSASLIGLTLPVRSFISEAIRQTVIANGLKEAYVRVTVSRGKGPIGLDPALCKTPTFVVIAEEFHPYPEEYYSNGVKLVVSAVMRNHIMSINPKIKSLNFLNNILAKIEAKTRGAYEAIMLNSEGYLAEGTVCNIFFVREGVVCTPSAEAGILDGITRELVIGLLREKGLHVTEGLFLPEELRQAEEVFITNTTAEVLPVSAVDDVRYSVGNIAHGLRDLYIQEVERRISGVTPEW